MCASSARPVPAAPPPHLGARATEMEAPPLRRGSTTSSRRRRWPCHAALRLRGALMPAAPPPHDRVSGAAAMVRLVGGRRGLYSVRAQSLLISGMGTDRSQGSSSHGFRRSSSLCAETLPLFFSGPRRRKTRRAVSWGTDASIRSLAITILLLPHTCVCVSCLLYNARHAMLAPARHVPRGEADRWGARVWASAQHAIARLRR